MIFYKNKNKKGVEKYIKRVQDKAEKQGEMLVMGRISYFMPLFSY